MFAGSEISYFGDNDLWLLQFRPGGSDSKNRSERFRETKNYHHVFGPVFGYLTRSTVILKSNSLKVALTRRRFMIFKISVKERL